MLNGLDLFSGIGGITYALQDWIKPVAYCEIEPYCQSVLLQRMQKGDLPKASIWDDIRTLSLSSFGDLSIISKSIDIICGGFPCQDISVAGAGKGLAGERSGLFYEIIRLCSEIKPRFIFLENVPAITTRGGTEVVREIVALGYDCRWCVISASSVGALHRRERWFLLAHSKYNGTSSCETRGSSGEVPSQREQQEQKEDSRQTERTSCLSSDVAYSQGKRLEGQRRSSLRKKETQPKPSLYGKNDCDPNSKPSQQAECKTMSDSNERKTWRDNSTIYRPFKSRNDWQEVVSNVCRVTDGVSCGMDRLKALGNAVVPQQVRKAWLILTGLEICK